MRAWQRWISTSPRSSPTTNASATSCATHWTNDSSSLGRAGRFICSPRRRGGRHRVRHRGMHPTKPACHSRNRVQSQGHASSHQLCRDRRETSTRRGDFEPDCKAIIGDWLRFRDFPAASRATVCLKWVDGEREIGTMGALLIRSDCRTRTLSPLFPPFRPDIFSIRRAPTTLPG